jgi:hypothetical protein
VSNDTTKRYVAEPTSAPGDFYVEYNCCTSCGYPQVLAPDLIGWVDAPMNHCYWMKQPETSSELDQAFKVFDGQELGCHRYAGLDPEIQRRVGYDQCDNVPNALRRASNRLTATWGKPSDPPSPEQSLWSRLMNKFRGS